MRKNMFVLSLVLIFTLAMAQSGIETAFLKAIEKGLTNAIRNDLSNIKEKIPTILKKPYSVDSVSYPRQLTPAVIEKAIYNLRRMLPETIPMVPFAIAEPTSSDILFYFGILNSLFRNLTQFSCNASVENTVSSFSTEIDFHVNTSSLEGHYELDVSSYDMHLYGDGEYRIVTNGTEAAIFSKIEIGMDDSFKMTDFLLNISISSGKLTMSNLLGGDPSAEKLTQAISDEMPAEIVTLSELVQQTVNSSVVDLTNSIFASLMSWSDIVALIYDIADM